MTIFNWTDADLAQHIANGGKVRFVPIETLSGTVIDKVSANGSVFDGVTVSNDSAREQRETDDLEQFLKTNFNPSFEQGFRVLLKDGAKVERNLTGDGLIVNGKARPFEYLAAVWRRYVA